MNLEIINLTERIQRELEPDKNTNGKDISLNSDKAILLIIEDNPDMQQYIHDLCKPYYQCLLAENGQQGLALAIEYIPDVILSDIMMPELDGYECLKAIKQDRHTCHIPVILLTALKDRDYRIRALKENASDVLTKPFDSEELIIRIKNILAFRQLIELSANNKIQKEMLTLPPDSNHMNELDQLIIDRFKEMLEEHYSNEELDSLAMAQHLLMSERQVQRKIKALTRLSPTEHLRNFRLEKAVEVLRNGYGVEYVAYEVGFASRTYFSKCFKDKYGMNPKDYQKQINGALNST